MVEKRVLKRYGCTQDRIRKVFTCEDPQDPCYQHRKDFEEKICNRITTGIEFSLANSHMYSVADLAWDSAPILKQNIPLMLYAQGKIKVDQCRKELDKLGCSNEFIKQDEKGQTFIDVPRFYEISVNLVRSYLTRRIAAQASRYSGLFPHFKYEPRATDAVGKLRADALSQRVEIMSDQYGYQHLQVQLIRNMFLYGMSLLFPQCAWDKETGTRAKSDDKNPELETYVAREGVPFTIPHPSRLIWDHAQPLATLNTDTGCEYVGFWDVVKFAHVEKNPAYFNRQRIRISDTGVNVYSKYGLYFDTQLNAQKIAFPSTKANDLAIGNDAKTAYTFYSGSTKDESLFMTQYYERVIPSEVGLGDYNHPVWLRLIVASDDTVIYGEFLPSIPAVYFGYNANDQRVLNISPAHEIMPWQDQVSNMLSQLLLTAKASALKVIMLDTDLIDDDEIVEAIRKTLQSKDYYVHPLILEFSGNKSRALGTNSQSGPLRVEETNMERDITQYFRSIAQLLAIIERLMVLSPQELGQAAPREITATEASEIASSTSTVYNFISDSLDEGRAAWKKLLYESIASCSTVDIEVPVVNQYSNRTVEAAGFIPMGDDLDPAYTNPRERMILGSATNLVHDYVFTTRDGADRPSNQQAASTLVQLTSALLNNEVILRAVGKRKIYEIFNEIFRKSGAGVDLKLEVQEGEPNEFGPDPAQQEAALQEQSQAIQQQQQMIQQLVKAIEDIGLSVQDNRRTIEEISRIFTSQSGGLGITNR